MPKLAKCNHLFSSEIINMTNFPLLESILEIIHHGNLVSGRIKEDNSQATSHMHHSEPLARFHCLVPKLSNFLNQSTILKNSSHTTVTQQQQIEFRLVVFSEANHFSCQVTISSATYFVFRGQPAELFFFFFKKNHQMKAGQYKIHSTNPV